MHYRLELENYKTIEAAIASIPEGTTSLDLSRNQLGTKTDDELLKLIRGIPTSVWSLDLSANDLGHSAAELVPAFREIRSSITTLNLEQNCLGFKNNLIALIGATPGTVKSLNLASNVMHLKGADEVMAMLDAIKPTVESFDFSANELGERTGEELEGIINRFKPGVTSLNLSNNQLNEAEKSAPGTLAKAFKGFSGNLKKLSLAQNDLGLINATELANIFNAAFNAASNLVELDLSVNYFYLTESLATAFQAMTNTPNLVVLNLAGNGLGYTQWPASLPEIFRNIPRTKVLNLSVNHFYNISPLQLNTALEAVSFNVKSINLRRNCLFWEKTHPEIDEILNSLNTQRYRIDLSKNNEAEFARIIAPLINMHTRRTHNKTHTTRIKQSPLLPLDVLPKIAFFATGVSEHTAYHKIKSTIEDVNSGKYLK